MGRLMRAPDHGEAESGATDAGNEGESGDQSDTEGEAEGETDEQKAEREAAEAAAREGETDEQKAAREVEEARAAFYGAPAEDAPYEITGLPEKMEIDKAALDAITPVARELNLSSAGLSKIAGVYAEHVLPGIAQRYQADLENQIVTQSRAWEQETRDAIAGKVELKTAGGDALTFDGKNQKEVEGVAARALDKLAPEGFRDFLRESGLGNNPGMNAFVYQVGKLIKEDTDHEPAGRDRANSGQRTGPAMSDPDKFYAR